jgi:hypothetical protein
MCDSDANISCIILLSLMRHSLAHMPALPEHHAKHMEILRAAS